MSEILWTIGIALVSNSAKNAVSEVGRPGTAVFVQLVSHIYSTPNRRRNNVPFIPKLPTWNLAVTPWTFNPGTGEREAGAAFEGQLYPPLRTSDNLGPSDCYLVYPKEVDALHDPCQYDNAGTDAILFTHLGITYGFVVQQVIPRWATFPNQHYLALLRRMTEAEIATIEIPQGDEGASGLPSFPTPAEVWHVVAEVPGATLKGETMVQGVAMEMTHHADTRTSFYFLYPISAYPLVKSEVMLSEVEVSEYDVIKCEWPTGSGDFHYWYVSKVEPRRLGFPNEHMQSCGTQLGLFEILFWFTEVDEGESSIVVSPASIINDDIQTALVTVTYKDSLGNPFQSYPVTITDNGVGTLDTPTGLTDENGVFTSTYHSDTVEDVEFSTALIGPSNTLSVVEPSFYVDLAGLADDTCTACNEFEGPHNLNPLLEVTPGNWASYTDLEWECLPDGEGQFELAFNSTQGVVLSIIDPGGEGLIVQYQDATATSWDMVSPVTCTLVGVSFDVGCTFPGTVEVGTT